MIEIEKAFFIKKKNNKNKKNFIIFHIRIKTDAVTQHFDEYLTADCASVSIGDIISTMRILID